MSGPLNQVRFYCYDMGERLAVYLSLTQMFQLPSMIVMSIAAARMYRNLADFVCGSTDMCFFLRFLCLLRSLLSMTCRSSESLEIIDGKSTKTKAELLRTDWDPTEPDRSNLGHQLRAAFDGVHNQHVWAAG